MTKLKMTIKRAWNWLLGKTTIDEKIVSQVNEFNSTIQEVMEQVGDVVEAAKGGIVIEGKATKSKIRTFKKGDLIEHAKLNFGVDLDSSLTKTNIVNKVYELHNGVAKGSGAKSSGKGAGKGKGAKSSGKGAGKGKGAKSSGKGAGKKSTARKGAGKSKK